MLWNKCQLRMLHSEGQHTLLPFYITCTKQMAQLNVKQQAHLQYLTSLCFGCFIASVSPTWSSFVMTRCFPSRCDMTRSSVAWSGIPRPSALTCSGTRCFTTIANDLEFHPSVWMQEWPTKYNTNVDHSHWNLRGIYSSCQGIGEVQIGFSGCAGR